MTDLREVPSGLQSFAIGPLCCGARSVTENTVVMDCPAKLNLYLEVLGKRPDGYHELETVMLRTSLADQLTIRPNASGQLRLRFSDATPEPLRSGIPLDERNLVLRAAHSLRQYCSVSSGAEFVLHKRIPAESGLAGGSSNAAAALLGCCRIWNLKISGTELHSIAAALGSDINFLLSGVRAAVCRGRGEIVEPIERVRPLCFVAIRPRLGNSTAAVFRSTRIPRHPQTCRPLIESLTFGHETIREDGVFNRLTEAARQLNPEMTLLMSQMGQLTSKRVFMSGSGSTVFVLARHASEARKIQALFLQKLRRTSWILEC